MNTPRRLTGYVSAAAMLLGLGFFAERFLAGAYSYFLTDRLEWHFTSNWTKNGAPGFTPFGLTGTGSLIYQPVVPGEANSYEVRTELRLLGNGGTFISFLRATADAAPLGVGTRYYSVELQNPTFTTTPSGAQICTATLAILKKTALGTTVLTSTIVPCRNSLSVRSVIIRYDSQNAAVMAYVDNHRYLYHNISETEIPTGQRGIGISNAGGNSIRQVDLGSRDTVPPPPLTQQNVSVWTSANRVDFQVRPTVDNQTGVYQFDVYRNNVLILQSDLNGFSDPTVTPGTTYT